MPATYTRPASLAPITGIHHVTAVASDPQRNMDFYTQVLGLRFVKLTVNFDDPGTYHFYFGNERGEPGTVLTFFPWPHVKRGIHGTGSVFATAFSAPAHSVQWWKDRLTSQAIAFNALTRFDDQVIAFEDSDGMKLEIVFHTGRMAQPWKTSDIPLEHALRGFHSVTLALDDSAATASVLQQLMGFTHIASESGRDRYQATGSDQVFARVVDLISPGNLPINKLGAGIVHHVAFRTPNLDVQDAWQKTITRQGLHVTPILDRNYFRSIYFREPGQVLFEFATDSPGFDLDEPLHALGTTLKLPPQYESQRARIEQTTPRLKLPGGITVSGR